MKWMIGLMITAVMAGFPVGAQESEEASDLSRIQGFRVPTYDDEGRMTSMIFGEYAVILPDGMVDITDLRMEFYEKELDASGERVVQMEVESPKCFYHRGRGVAVSDSAVKITRDQLVVMGEGFMWNNRDQTLVIISKTRVELTEVNRAMAQE